MRINWCAAQGSPGARWAPDGAIEYLGRNDLQVKVRGFRIELGEVEARLAEMEGVGEVVVVAREDVPGDQRLVAYYTAAAPDAADAEALRAHARNGLPEYMVPSVFVRLEALPLATSGKVDRRALPVPERGASSRGNEPPRGALEEKVAQIWAEVLKVERVGRNENFFDLGGHSLLAVRLVSRVSAVLGERVAVRTLLIEPTLAGFTATLDRQRETGGQASNLVPLVPDGVGPPVFVVHDGGGGVDHMQPLASRLDSKAAVFGLMATGLVAGEAPSASIPEMAARYVEAIREAQPAGPYRLIGYSAGGVIAYAMAERLLADGDQVCFLGMIDSSVALARKPTFQALIDRIERTRGTGMDEVALVEYVLGAQVPPDRRAAFDALVGTGDILAMRRVLIEAEVLPDDLDDETWLRLVRVRLGIYEGLARYRPSALPVDVTLFCASPPANGDPTLGWGEVVRDRLRTIAIGGKHETMLLPPHLERLSAAINECLAAIGEVASRAAE